LISFVFFFQLVVVAFIFWWVRREAAEEQKNAGSFFAKNERVFVNDAGETVPFEAFVVDRATKYLSVIVPAYNEEKRIGVMLDEALAYLLERERTDKAFSFEILVVSDGSRDQTARVVRQYSERHGSDRVRMLDLVKNVGKGGAVRRGMLCARGKLLLMADADGASRFSDVAALERAFLKLPRPAGGNADELCGFAVGSRAHMREVDDGSVKRSVIRGVLMWGLHVLVMLLGNIWTVQDTQCFPDDDHEILTNRGFLSLSDVLAHLGMRRSSTRSASRIDWRGLQVANYDRKRGAIVYDTPDALVVNKRAPSEPLVEFRTAADNSSLRATANHAMYVRDADTETNSAFVKVSAAQLVGGAPCSLLAHAASGVEPTSPLQFATELGVTSQRQSDAVLALCGAALVRRCVWSDSAWTRQQLAAAGLKERVDWTVVVQNGTISITNAAWAAWFGAQCDDTEWLWSSLTRDQARVVVAGMLQLTAVPAVGSLRVESASERDVALRLLMHAGFAASFEALRKKRDGGWRIAFGGSDAADAVQPLATAQWCDASDAKRTWCFTMPARNGDDSGFVVVRRVQRATDGSVVAASRATIQGNCGFKLFGRRTAHQLFNTMHIERWAFDLELLFLAINYYKTPVVEVPINWQEIDGSKVNVIDATLQILRDLARIRFNYTVGLWKHRQDLK
jgi:glycosyltransferase involved in cell wall biosynthesis